MTLTIYHNPRCSKSRETLALLTDKGLDPVIIEYLKSPPSSEELTCILAKLGIPGTALIRTKETAFKELGRDAQGITDEEAIQLMVANPALIERPIVVNGGRAALGRPPEQVLEIL